MKYFLIPFVYESHKNMYAINRTPIIVRMYECAYDLGMHCRCENLLTVDCCLLTGTFTVITIMLATHLSLCAWLTLIKDFECVLFAMTFQEIAKLNNIVIKCVDIDI